MVTGTENPDCDEICDGEVTVRNQERFGVIGEAGNSFRLFLGAGIATNGFNCALLAASIADATLVTEGSQWRRMVRHRDGEWLGDGWLLWWMSVGWRSRPRQ